VSRTVAFATLGCRLNQVDTQELQGRLEARGFRTVPFEDRADVVVVNTCTVTARADVSDRQAIRRAVRVNPDARVVVTGCWAQTDPTAAAALAGVDLVIGNGDKDRLPDLLEALLADREPSPERVHVGDVAALRGLVPAPLARRNGRSRAFLKIQDGCRHRCAFCIVPIARGGSRSHDPGVVLEQAQRLVAAGHPEIVLTGVDLGDYGADRVPRTTLAALLERLLAIPGLRWLRLSSVLPAYFTPALLEVVTGSKVIAPHLHIPLQSGSDAILRKMRRPYTTRMYRALVERLAAAIPRLGLGTDLIAGFPGETESDFSATVALVDALPFSYLHTFSYSARKATEAASFPDTVEARVIRRRSARLRAAGAQLNLAFRSRLVGEVTEALVLETRDRTTGRLLALTGNYVEVAVDGPDAIMGRLAKIRITAADARGTEGTLEPQRGAGEDR
jgi:threonylcarbamoyladenosine tRNA methylthiotransferase MtaB